MEGMTQNGCLNSPYPYALKHNPFAYLTPIIDDPARRAQIVPLRELTADVAAGRLPDFAFVVPDLCNSMHDCPVGVGDSWLRRTVGPLLHLPRTSPSTRA